MSSDKKCVVCGTEFEGRSDAQYCSGRCRQQALRDRGISDAVVIAAGVRAPIASFTAWFGAFGEVGHASIELGGLRGEPARDAHGFIPVELLVANERIWAGDLARIVRRPAAVRVEAVGLDSRLASQRWGATTWESLSAGQFARGAAERAGLTWTEPEQPLDPRPLGSWLAVDGTQSAAALLLLISRERGYNLHLTADGGLYLGPALPSEPRMIEARDVVLTGYGSSSDRIAVVVRSIASHVVGGHGGTLSTGRLADVAAGVSTYLCTVYGRRQCDIDALAERLSRELSARVVSVSATIDDASIVPGDSVRIAEAGDLGLRVTRVSHTFSAESGLTTRIEALHLPCAPAIAAAQPRSVPAQIVPPAFAA
jgi:hypothetical protein